MIIVTGREFRSSQAKYLGLAGNGEDVIIKSRAGSFRIIPVSRDDTVYNEAQLTQMIERSLKQIRDGHGIAMEENESSVDFVNRLICTP